VHRRLKDHEPQKPRAFKTTTAGQPTGMVIDGVGDLLSSFARCCRPVPPEAIAGYITLGRGVSIHRADCANLLRMRDQQPQRVLRWTGAGRRRSALSRRRWSSMRSTARD